MLSRKEFDELEMDVRIALIQQLIPLGLMAAAAELQREIAELAGERYGRKGESEVYRYGSNPGSIRLAGQKVPFRVPRIRDGDKEVTLRSYELLHRGVHVDEAMLNRVLYGLSCRDYEQTLPRAKGSIGTTKSSVSRAFVQESDARRKELEARRFDDLDIAAMLFDGKTFGDDGMVVALGVSITGSKHVLGIVQMGTENEEAVASFLRRLRDVQGLDPSKGLLVVSDGSKGFRSGLKKAYEGCYVHQRCQWHKRENIVSYLPKEEQDALRKQVQAAYNRPTFREANAALQKIRKELEIRNQSALKSLDEGYHETLALHRLGVFAQLGISLKTTNLIESVNSMLQNRCAKVRRWTNSAQKHRWVASALLDVEPRLRRLQGYKHLASLRNAIQVELKICPSGNEGVKGK